MTSKVFYVFLCLLIHATTLQSSMVTKENIAKNAIYMVKLLGYPALTIFLYNLIVKKIYPQAYSIVRKKIVQSYIKKAISKSFLSLVEMDYGSKNLKKERQQARKMVWESYIHYLHRSFNIPAIKLISELMNDRNSLFLNRGRKPIRSRIISQEKIEFMEGYCKKMGIDPSNVDFIIQDDRGAGSESVFSALHFHRKKNIIYFNHDVVIQPKKPEWQKFHKQKFEFFFFHELGHAIADHPGVGMRLKDLGRISSVDPDEEKRLERLMEFMADALVGLIDPKAARNNLEYIVAHPYETISHRPDPYLSHNNLFILQADIALLHGITIRECIENIDYEYKAERVENYLLKYQEADTNVFIQEGGSYEMPRFLPKILPDFLERQGINVTPTE